jgi:hypothetical protein
MRLLLRAVTMLAVAGLAVTMSCPPPAEEGLDVMVNDPSGDGLSNTTQSEASVARSGSIFVVGFNDSGEFNSTSSFTGYAYSTDGGDTFVDAGVLAPVAGGANIGDPALAVDGSGNFYFATLAQDSAANSYIGVAKSTSTSPAVTFGLPVLIPGLDPNGFQDKELIAVDATGGTLDGNVYVVWTEFPYAGGTRIMFSRSTDGGVTYSPAVQISTAGTSVQGAMPTVGQSGELYVAWEGFGGGSTGLIRFRRSLDGGLTWGTEVTAASFTRKEDQSASASCERPALNGYIRILDFPSIDVDRSNGPNRGRIYITYAGDPDGNQSSGDDADVYIVSSSDGGLTWTAPLTINKGPAVTSNADGTLNDNFFPAVSVAPNGNVNVIFYDRRNDSGNLAIDLFRARSGDGGQTWTNARITADAFGIPNLNPNFDPLVAACYMGDYNWAITDASSLLPAWGDNRREVLAITGPRPDPDVYFRSGLTP